MATQQNLGRACLRTITALASTWEAISPAIVMEPLLDLIITLHYTEVYEGRQRKYAHTISVKARSFGEAAQTADDYYKDLSRNSATLFGRRLVSIQIELPDAQRVSEDFRSDVIEIDSLV